MNPTSKQSEQAADATEEVAAEAVDETEAAPEAEVVALSPEQERIAELEGDLEALGAKLRMYSESTDRMRREFEASKARIQREHERSVEGDKTKAVIGLLGVLDSLDQALASTEDDGPFVQGVRMIQKEFGTALAELGLERFEAMGEAFDPERHEALTVMPVPDADQHNKVVHVMKQGAVVAGKVVRAATVVVGKHAGSDPAVN
ncbi:MAG: nucleotide exchange factor GrpE [Myxococcales bacterium]|nr:nucleotide exchange factor GrpE [Myxococcales bacterium]